MNLKTVCLSAFALLLFSLSLSAQQSEEHLRYIERFKTIAMQEMERTGVPASIKLAQGILESNAGRSYLARRGNNHFGIKCGGDWDGKKVYRRDDDYDDEGRLIESCFRGYRNADASYVAHSEFLRDPKKQFRYGFLFRLEPTDYRGWAEGLRRAGYATSGNYHRKLIDIIERYQLDRFDREAINEVVLEEETTRPKRDTDKEAEGVQNEGRPGVVYKNNDVRYTLARQGQTLSDISIQQEIALSSLLEYNDKKIRRNQKLAEGTVVYLQSKRDNYRGRQRWHYVKVGETMFGISQLYGIDLKCLYMRNRLETPQVPAVGERLKIRGGKLNGPPKLASATSNNPDVPTDIDEDGDGEVDMIEDDTEEDVPAKEDKEPFIPLPDLDEEEEEPKEERPTPPTKPTDRPDTEFDEDEVVEEEKPTPPPPAAVYYTVVKGDTLFSLSRRYGLTVEELKKMNNLTSNVLSVGQRLRVK